MLPDALHLTDDAHIARLIGKHGAVTLVRQLAEDLALRDAQIATLRARAADRERCLRKIILECGLSSLDLETRLRALEQEQEARVQLQIAQAQAQANANAIANANAPTASATASIPTAQARRVSDLVSDAMSDDNSLKISSDYYYNDATIRAASSAAASSAAAVAAAAAAEATAKKTGTNASNTGTSRGWKDYLWGGGTAKKAPSTGSGASGAQTPQKTANTNTNTNTNTAVRVTAAGGDRRPTITDDLFQPPVSSTSAAAEADDTQPARSNSRASSIASAATSQSGRKPSLASMALRLVGAGGSGGIVANGSDSSLYDGSAGPGTPSGGSASAAASLRMASGAGNRRPGLPATTIGRSSRASTLQGSGSAGTSGPRSLMSLRRTTSSAVLSGAGAVAALNGASPQTIPGRSGSGGGGGGGGSDGRGGSSSGTQALERWGEMMDASPANDGDMRRTTYFPVEMDTILPLDVQPPTLTHMYNRYNSSGLLIDRFGFIYDQRRKKRQREAAQVAQHAKRGSRHSETLDTGSGRASRVGRPSPTMIESGSLPEDAGIDEPYAPAVVVDADDRASTGDASSLRGSTMNDNDGASHRPPSPSMDSAKDVSNENGSGIGGVVGLPKRWQDYLKIATFPTELLLHTPAMSDSRIEVITESVAGRSRANSVSGDSSSNSTTDATADAGLKSPGFITSDGRGFVPPSTGALAAATTAAATSAVNLAVPGPSATTGRDTDSIASSLTEATTDNIMSLAKQPLQQKKQPLQLQPPPAAAAAPPQPPKEDAEPVRLLLQQLSELHDNLQKERTVRWNEFLRKVRAERRREGEMMALAAAAAAAEGAGGNGSGSGGGGGGNGSGGGGGRPSLHATAVMPETRLADGEIVGVAGLGNKGKLGRAKWNEFRALVLGGIPVVLRAKVWAECTGATSLRVPGMYDDLVAGRGGGTDDSLSGSGDHAHHEDRADVVAQIQADIHRTLTDNIFFREGPGTAKLNEVLLAYARRNPDVGYCQGMNLIAANLLLVTPSAEDAFWLLASIIETILPVGYYDHSLAGSRADQQVLRAYVADVLPRLSAHFDALSIDLETMTFQWFLSVFTDCLSAEVLFRVWDVVFCLNDGSVFLFQVALALLKLNEAALLRCETPAEIYTYINHQMTNHAISIDGLIQASEALRKLVRREDVEVRRQAALEAERALVAARAAAVEEARAARQQKLAARVAAAEAA